MGRESDEDAKVLPLLQECVAQQAPIYVTSPDRGAIYSGRCAGLMGSELILELLDRGGPTSIDSVFAPLTQTVVSFSLGNRSGCFITHVRRTLRRDTGDAGEARRVLVAIPEQIGVAVGRLMFRVDTTGIDALQCMVAVRSDSGGILLPARVMNLSDSGVLFCFEADSAPQLDVGTVLTLTFGLRAERATVEAIVRRVEEGEDDDRAYGCFYPIVVNHPELVAPPQLRSLVQAAEREWLNRGKMGDGAET